MEILVFQQFGSAERKIEGIRKFGKKIKILDVISVDESLPEVVDKPENYINDDFTADLVLNFLKHPDISDCLVDMCVRKSIPVVTTGKPGNGFTPFTCCGLGRSDKLGEYGKQFGFPEYVVDVEDGRISHIDVSRGAPCGATWAAIIDMIGCPLEEAFSKLPLKVQQNCFANPAAFDPISGKSSVHFAGYVHLAALKKALEVAEKTKIDQLQNPKG